MLERAMPSAAARAVAPFPELGWLRWLIRFVGCWPLSWASSGGRMVGRLAASVFRIRRRHVESALRSSGIPATSRTAVSVYTRLATSALEFLWFAAHPEASPDLCTELSPRTRTELERILGLGRGLVIAASHTANWELAAFRIARERPLTAVVKRQGSRRFDELAGWVRRDRGVTTVHPGAALPVVRAALRRGEMVAVMIDQVPASRRGAQATTFFGQVAWADRAAAALSARTGAPLVVAASHRTRGMSQLEILAVHVPPSRAGPEWVSHVTEAATSALERFVKVHPTDWLWLHRRWRPPPPQPFERSGRKPVLVLSPRSAIDHSHEPRSAAHRGP